MQLNHPTTGIVNKGAIVEREVEQNVVNADQSLTSYFAIPMLLLPPKWPKPSTNTTLDPLKLRTPPPLPRDSRRLPRAETIFLAAISQVDVRPNVPAKSS